MHFYELMKEKYKDKEVLLFVDMDGVIASYDFGRPLDFKNKRPMKTNIETLRKVSELENVTLNILSICRKDYQIQEKNEWLDLYAPFFKKENRNVISKESVTGFSSAELKLNFLENLDTDKLIIMLDDDNKVLEVLSRSKRDIILYQDSELVD
ncbi:MAG: hypothetical protein IKO78_00550 [Bacilli bacterium]|nr:hypothetical protein [Bacilli bacterium]